MKLLLDIGNSRVKWAYADQGELQHAGAVNHHENNWQAALPHIRPDAIWAACVAGENVLAQIQAWAGRQWQQELHLLHSVAQACDVNSAYPRPERLGVDRWMACIAGFHHGQGSVLVADAGTAITLDFVDAQGQHKGGLISPGVATMRQALRGGTRLRTELKEYKLSWLADDTDPAVGLGTLHTALALLENARRELAPGRCLLTGGESTLLAPQLSDHWQLAPNLVLDGINRIALASNSREGN